MPPAAAKRQRNQDEVPDLFHLRCFWKSSLEQPVEATHSDPEHQHQTKELAYVDGHRLQKAEVDRSKGLITEDR